MQAETWARNHALSSLVWYESVFLLTWMDHRSGAGNRCHVLSSAEETCCGGKKKEGHGFVLSCCFVCFLSINRMLWNNSFSEWTDRLIKRVTRDHSFPLDRHKFEIVTKQKCHSSRCRISVALNLYYLFALWAYGLSTASSSAFRLKQASAQIQRNVCRFLVYCRSLWTVKEKKYTLKNVTPMTWSIWCPECINNVQF